MLNQLEPEKILQEIPQLHEQSSSVSRAIHKWVLRGGKNRRVAADFLHGTWLGHPLHPVLTDVTLGAWLFGSLFDLLSLFNCSKGVEEAADRLITIGNLSAVPTALAGLTDYSTIPHRAMSTGAVHGLLNASGLVLNIFSSILRKSGSRGLGMVLTSITMSVLMISAWLGGEMSYKYKVGINKIPTPPDPEDWKTALDEQNLAEGAPVKVEVDGSPILLYRFEGQVYAVGAVCGHESGPLEEGDFDGHCVTCPWHQSVYDLRDGSVVHGPTTYALPIYAVRIREGKIEVRLKEKPANQTFSQPVTELKDKLAS